MSETASISTTQKIKKEYSIYREDKSHEERNPFIKLIRYNSVAGMTYSTLENRLLERNRDEILDELDFKPSILNVWELMVSGAKLSPASGSAVTAKAVIDKSSLASTDEMIIETASDLRDKKEIENEITKLLSWGADIEFEQGMENDFTRALESMVLNYGDLAIGMLNDAIRQRNINEDLIAEIAQYLGTIIDEKTNFNRRLLLIQLLESKSNFVRYGAVIGLENLNDPKALPDIRAAAKSEQFQPLQTEMMEIADNLGS